MSLRKDTSDYSQTTSATIRVSPTGIAVLPAQQLDSSTVLLRWAAFPGVQRYRLNIVNFLPSFNSSCSEWRSVDSTLIPPAYRGIGKLIAGTSDTVRGLRAGLQYRFHVSVDSAERRNNPSLPESLFIPRLGVVGNSSIERNAFSSNRKFLMLQNQSTLSQPISYYEAPWRSTGANYFTFVDSNYVRFPHPTGYIAIRTLYQQMITRLDSMKKIGIPVDTAYIALGGMLGIVSASTGFDVFSCYSASAICVFTLRRPDARVTQFARAGNGWLPFSWDADYFRVVFPTVTSVQDKQENSPPSVEISPNPTTDELRLTYSLASAANVDVEVFSALGQRVCALRQVYHAAHWEQQHTIPTRDWASGLYFLRLTLRDASGKVSTITRTVSVLH